MEIIRNITHIARHRTNDSPNVEIPQAVYPYFEKGERLAKSKRLGDLLSLEGNDATLLYLLCGLKLLYDQIDKDTEIFYTLHLYTHEIFQFSKDSTKNTKQRNDTQILDDLINNFMQDHYSTSDINRAWTLRNAVNNLFSQTRYVDQKTGRTNWRWNTETIKQWAEEWKPRIHQDVTQLPV